MENEFVLNIRVKLAKKKILNECISANKRILGLHHTAYLSFFMFFDYYSLRLIF